MLVFVLLLVLMFYFFFFFFFFNDTATTEIYTLSLHDALPLWLQVATTMEETVLGFVLGSCLGIGLGILLGRLELLSEILSPFIKAANSIPRVVLGGLFAVMLGLDIRGKVATAAVLVFFVVFFNAFQGVREVDRNLIANARILGADNRRLTTRARTWVSPTSARGRTPSPWRSSARRGSPLIRLSSSPSGPATPSSPP